MRPGSSESGRISPAGAVTLATVLLFAALAGWLFLTGSPPSPGDSADRLSLFCAAGLKPPVEAAAREYRELYGVEVDLQYGGSGTLLGQLEVVRRGDLYLPGDDSYIELARGKGLVAEVLSVATMRPVIGVAAGNPRGVASLADLRRADLAVGLAEPEAAAAGRIARDVLASEGLWDAVRANAKVLKPTVTELAGDLELGALDAALIWDATAAQFAGIDCVRVPPLEAAPRSIALGVLESSSHPTEALRFARFLAARDAGLAHFARLGYPPVEGDLWDPSPELLLMSGAMLSDAIDRTVTAFEEREGVRVTRVYNGCGILVSQMRAGERPDAYFSCDSSFMDLVADLFAAPELVSENRMVILVAGGNPKGVASLADLARPGLRVGLAHPEKSALGALTRRLLERLGCAADLDASGNLAVESPTGDFLVNQIHTGSLDAVVVYRSNAAHVLDDLDIVAIEDASALAHQPYAVGRGSDHPHLMRRLLDAIETEDSRARFESLGFGWRVEAAGR